MMNFRNFYQTASTRLKDAIISLWASGEADMQGYFSRLLDEEGLMAEPVIQTAFPWEAAPVTFEETTNIFDREFIAALDKAQNREYRFPANRHPYKHQVESWKAMLEKRKSIAVITGTGSGKTECFMLPVLYDIYRNYHDQPGVNAIFLYPLNALIGSQKKRVAAWCKALGGINFAVYNGQTQENAQPRNQQAALPELISRAQIRRHPPQILFTNPSMLEYLLVRNKDVPLLQNSQGTLRWILLDEAHTLTGSSAAEMALLIRRVVDAFGADPAQLRFAITSATVGSGEESTAQLTQFMSGLCGIEESQITVIGGKRVLSPELPSMQPELRQLREQILQADALPLSAVHKTLRLAPNEDALGKLDVVCKEKNGTQSVLPVRGHFFARGIGGVFSCTNPACARHSAVRPLRAVGAMTTVAGRVCSCGWPLLELVACRSCGNQLIESEHCIDSTGDEKLRMISAISQDPFAIERADEDDEERVPPPGDKFYCARYIEGVRYDPNSATFAITQDGVIDRSGRAFCEANGGTLCPHCGEDASEPMHFRISSSFINRVLADILLEETPETEEITDRTLWKGHKYISFTDSRQGTARIAALINQDQEANWVRSQVFHKLNEIRGEWKQLQAGLTEEERQSELESLRLKLASETRPYFLNSYKNQIAELEGMSEAGSSAAVSLDWEKLKDHLLRQRAFETLFKGNNPRETDLRAKGSYLNAILYDQFARRLPRERSLENLGMVSVVYPRLQQSPLAGAARELGITLPEWRDLLKIAADYVIRYAFHFSVNPQIYPYTAAFIVSQAIYPSGTNLAKVKKWPVFEKKRQQNRLCLLICAGLGLHDLADIDRAKTDQLNDLLEAIWLALRPIMDQENDGYKLNLETQTRFALSERLWLCPVKKRLIDAQFRGYSPWIRGTLASENIHHYKIEKVIRFPDFQATTEAGITRDAIEAGSGPMRADGVWNNLHEQILLRRPLYLSGEHSAQQDEARLKELEGQFERSEINILNCSTTMEMGVDIGGISAVVMNNVPPSPANYLQRAGRAGRRAEAQSLAFTICAPNPIGMQAMADPMWALKHPIAPPLLSFKSELVAERHVNAFFLGKFVQSPQISGMRVNMKIKDFFFGDGHAMGGLFIDWLSTAPEIAHRDGLRKLVKDTMLGTKSLAFLRERTAQSFQNLSDKTHQKKNGYEAKLQEFIETFGESSPAYKNVNYQLGQFLHKNAITYLAEQGFLPSAGLPTGIVEFDTVNIDDLRAPRLQEASKKNKPSYFITRALSEFAPGNQVVIDGKCFISAGIVMENDRGVQAEREIIQSCTNCGYQRIIEVARDEHPMTMCPHCDQTAFRGIEFNNGRPRGTFTEMIQPAGFAVDIYEGPTRKINEHSSVQYVDPLLINIRPWQNESSDLFDVRESEEDAEILYYNIGAGSGYSICLHCGRADTDGIGLAGHRRLRGGKSDDSGRDTLCTGNISPMAIRDNVVLAGRFKTDFCEIRIKDENQLYTSNTTLLYSLGTVFSKELAHFLAVEESEISFGVKHYETFSTIFIFDTAKGGAGYSSQFVSYADQIFRHAQSKLSACDCDAACTKCLIDRYTQWHLDKLDRLAALRWLARVADQKVPEHLLAIWPELKPLTGGIAGEIGRLRYLNKLQSVRLYGSGGAPEELPFAGKLKNHCRVDFVFDQPLAQLSTQEKISLLQLSAWSELLLAGDHQPAVPLQTLCKITEYDGRITEYLAAGYQRQFGPDWGRANDGIVYKKTCTMLELLRPLPVPIDEQAMFDVLIDAPGAIASNTIADLLLEQALQKRNLESLMKGQSFEVLYVDRYLRSPLGAILLTQFLSRLSDRLEFSISSFKFEGQQYPESPRPALLFHNFRNASERNKAIEDFAAELDLASATAVNEDIPHYRFFEFKSDRLRVIIRPDAGIEHGWFLSGSTGKYYNAYTSAATILQISKKDGSKPILYTISIEA